MFKTILATAAVAITIVATAMPTSSAKHAVSTRSEMPKVSASKHVNQTKDAKTQSCVKSCDLPSCPLVSAMDCDSCPFTSCGK